MFCNDLMNIIEVSRPRRLGTKDRICGHLLTNCSKLFRCNHLKGIGVDSIIIDFPFYLSLAELVVTNIDCILSHLLRAWAQCSKARRASFGFCNLRAKELSPMTVATVARMCTKSLILCAGAP